MENLALQRAGDAAGQIRVNGQLPPRGDASLAVQAFGVSLADVRHLIGPNAAMTGKDDKAPSGRAILASQQGGTIELGPLSDALRQWQWRVYRQLWNRVRQYWTAEKWIRVTDDEEKLRWVGLNKPVQIVSLNAKDSDIVNMAAIAAYGAGN